MKKILSKFEKSERIENSNGGSSGSSSHQREASCSIGKTFSVGQTTVTVEDILAEGGSAVVFLTKANVGGTTTRYALKRMYFNNQQDLSAAKREIQIASNLAGHKNIIGYIDSNISTQQDGIYEVLLLMPYCKQNVLGMMNAKLNVGFTEQEVLQIFCDIAEAVSRLHNCQTPIIHRDLKVENILQNEVGDFVLCDFGSSTARVLNPSIHGATKVEEEIQKYTTLAYRSPEMVDFYIGEPITTKSDVWALGCLLYKLMFFKTPFGESILAIQNGNFSIPDTSPYSRGLHQLVKYMLEPDQNKRPDIWQVCEIAFQLQSKPNPVINIKKTIPPLLENLPIPPMESELKRSQSTRSTPFSLAKQMQNPESGTSVAPRQRPKASISAQALPLVQPPSPSQRSTNTLPSPLPAPVPPPIPEQDTDAIEKQKNAFLSTVSETDATQTIPNTVDNNLFPSNFPDPFESSGTTATNTVKSAGPQLEVPLRQVQNLVPKDNAGHRRNLSDTTAFNRVYATETNEFLAPYEVSQKSRNKTDETTTSSSSSTISAGGSNTTTSAEFNTKTINQNYSETIKSSENIFSVHVKTSISATEMQKNNSDVDVSSLGSHRIETALMTKMPKWNPFEDPTPFNQMTEDNIFDAEFDAIRKRSSQDLKSLPIDAAGFRDMSPIASSDKHQQFVAAATTTTPQRATSNPQTATSTPNIMDDPFASAPFSLPRDRISTKMTRRKICTSLESSSSK